MDINENQKSVQKSLRNTLNADLLWESSNPKERQESLMIKIAEALGEDKDSPWYGRVRTGEESGTVKRCITTEVVKSAIKDSSLLNTYDKKGVKKHGTFDKDENDNTYAFLHGFIKDGLRIIKEKNKEEWEMGSDGNLTINNTSYALIRILSDIADIKLKENSISIAPNKFVDECKSMIEGFADSISSIQREDYISLRKYGEGGKKHAWRTLQVNFNSRCAEFTNPDLVNYIESISTKNNDEAKVYIEQLENYLRKSFKNEISTKDEIFDIVGDSVLRKMYDYESTQKLEKKKTGSVFEIDQWECISFEEIIQIIRIGSNWTDFAQKILTSNDFKKNKTDTIDWLNVMHSSKKKVKEEKPITVVDFALVKEVHKVFIGGSIETSN